jgi:hypothetical protein
LEGAGERGLGVMVGVAGYLVVGDQAGADLLLCGVFGVGEQERAGLGEGVGVPSAGLRSLTEDQVNVAAFAHAQADPDVRL